MRKLAILAFALAACGSDGKDPVTPVDTQPADTQLPDTQPPPPDSQVLDLACAANTTAPTTAPASVTASGVANQLTIEGQAPTVAPLPSATIEVCVDDCEDANLLATTTSAANGCGAQGCEFTTSVTTGGTPIDGYLRVSKQGVITANIFPSEPISGDVAGVPAIAVDPAVIGALALFGISQNKGEGMLIVRVSDCSALTGVEGSSPTVTDAKGVTVGDTPLDAGALDATLSGTFLVLNVPPGIVTVGASVNGTTFRAHDVIVIADELTATQVTPGFANP